MLRARARARLRTVGAGLCLRQGAGVSPDLESVVLDCLAKAPLARPASTAEVARRLVRCAERTLLY
jgi:hypothetical protein